MRAILTLIYNRWASSILQPLGISKRQACIAPNSQFSYCYTHFVAIFFWTSGTYNFYLQERLFENLFCRRVNHMLQSLWGQRSASSKSTDWTMVKEHCSSSSVHNFYCLFHLGSQWNPAVEHGTIFECMDCCIYLFALRILHSAKGKSEGKKCKVMKYDSWPFLQQIITILSFPPPS